MPGRRNIAAVMVLYHPEETVIANIDAILAQVDLLYLIDNSDDVGQTQCRQIPLRHNMVRLENKGNIGVAAALNRAAHHAVEQGFEYLLTMDQDSMPRPGMVEALMACSGPDIALAVPVLVTRTGVEPGKFMPCQPVLTAMTSGSLLSLSAYRIAGEFRDEFFIDFVDIEYCLRLNKCGYKVVRAAEAVLEHRVGRRLGKGGWFSVTTHSPLRKYYKTRNRMQVWREYGRLFSGYVRWDRIRFMLEFMRLLLFEPEKRLKIGMMWRGIRDYRAGRFGKYAGEE